MINQALLSRTLGQFPVSISTSLAIEGLLGIHEEHPTPKGRLPPWSDYDYLNINVRTLIRNVFTSMPSASAYLTTPKELAIVVAEEMQVIESVITDRIRDSKMGLGFYMPSYENIGKAFPRAVFRDPVTDKQKFYTKLEDSALFYLSRPDAVSLQYASQETVALKTTLGRGKSLLLSHYPIDILIAKHNRYSVLESHTGRIKMRHELTNKLKTSHKNMVPFDIMSIQTFGDTGDMFKPVELNVRRVLLKIAEKHKWNEFTTEEKIKANVSMANEPYLKEFIYDVYRAPRV